MAVLPRGAKAAPVPVSAALQAQRNQAAQKAASAAKYGAMNTRKAAIAAANSPIKPKPVIPNTVPVESPLTKYAQPAYKNTAALAPGMQSTANAPQMSADQFSDMNSKMKAYMESGAFQTPSQKAIPAEMMGPQVLPAQTKPPKDYSGAPSASQLEADARRNMAMAQKQAQTATPAEAPPDTAMTAAMAKGGMVKKPAAKKMAKGGVVIKANCGASVPPSQKFKK